jgi:hypothetical protein
MSVYTSQKLHYIYITNINLLLLHGEIIAVYPQNLLLPVVQQPLAALRLLIIEASRSHSVGHL